MSAPLPAQRRRRRLTREARDAFLEAVGAGWTVTHAAERAGHSRQRFYEERHAHEAFAAQWDEAIEAGTQVLENELHRRALEGYDEDTFDGSGQLIRRVRRYSPALLIFSLKARRPDVYRDNVSQRLEVTGAEGAPLQLEGRAVVGIADVVQLAIETGQGHLLGIPGLDAAAAGRELPAAGDVRPDHADD